jgi:hypothetical protein
MKQATVAGITVALGPVLQGCGGDENDPTDCGTISSPDACINNQEECHWDIETVEEQCNLQEDFDEALFNATKPETIEQAPGDLTFLGCADYDAVVAQRCVSVCEIDYNLPEMASQDRSEDENLLYKEMCTEEVMFRNQIMIFPLPIVSEDLETIVPTLTGDEIYQDVADLLKPDWTAYGNLADPRLRLTAEILQGKVSIANNTEDKRRVENASVDENWEIALRPTEAADQSGRHLELGGSTLAQYQAEAGSDPSPEVALEQHFINDVFPDKAEDFAKGVLLRFQVLDALAEKGESSGVNSDNISIVQADLENSSFAWDESFVACNLDRNCGFDFSTGKCAKVADYCASFSLEDCPDNTQADGVDPYDVMTYQTDTDAGTNPAIPTPVDVSADSSGIMREYKGYVEYKETVSKCSSYTDSEGGHCGAPDEYVACEALGFVTEQSGDVNVCVQYDLKPTPWEARTYSEDGSFTGYDPETFDTFATYYEILDNGAPVGGGENPRGCLNANSPDIDGNYYFNGPLGSGPFGYIGPVCTLPQDWDCTINTEADDEPGCNVTLAEICEYIEPSNGQCVSNSNFYAKYFDSATDTPLYESATVVFPEIEEEDLDAEAEEEGSDDELMDGDDFDGSKIG